MAKLLKLRRGSTSQHGSFTGAEGEVTVDTTKDVLVVHDGSTAGGHPMAAQDMDNVPAGSILGTQLENSGVTAGQYGSSSAIPIVTVDAQGLVTAASTTAIDSTTIANGTSNVAVANNGNITATRSGTARLVVDNAGVDITGTLDVSANSAIFGDLTISSATPKIFLTDNNNNPDFVVKNQNGAFTVQDTTNSSDRLVINSSGAVSIGGNLSVSGGSNSFGNTTINGGGGAGGVALTVDYNGTDVFKVNNVGSVTVNGTVDGRDIAADGSKLDGIESGAKGDQTAAEIKTLLQSNKLTASEIANDAIGTNQIAAQSIGTAEIAPDAVDVTKMLNFPTGTLLGRSSAGTGNATTLTASQVRSLLNIENGATADQSASEILTLIKTVDGSGSGLDADLLDGVSSGSFARSDANDTWSGTYNISSGKLGLKTTPGNNMNGRNAAFCIGDNDTGLAQNGDGQLEAWANNSVRFLWTSGDILSYGTFRPASNNSVDLGTSGNRWRNVFTNDLNLSNEGGANDIDGSWGNWTIQEGESDLFLKNNRSGKKYKFNLTEVS